MVCRDRQTAFLPGLKAGVSCLYEDEPHPKSYVKKMKGHSRSPLYSFRVGQYRAILTIEGNTMIITLVEVGNRSKVYRRY